MGKRSGMRIAVVTAYNEFNGGMYSVDLAAMDYLRELGHRPRLYRVHWHRRGIQFPFVMNRTWLHRLQDQSAFARADAILYWGDFLNSPLYATDDFRRRESYVGRSKELGPALERWKDLFLLRGFDKGARRAISVSNNFQSANAVLGTLPEADRDEIRSLLDANLDAIFPRDPVSTAEVERMLGPNPRPQIACGVDAAFLSPKPPAPAETAPDFAWFFKRSKLSPAEHGSLLGAVEQETGLAPRYLGDWLRLHFWTWDREYRQLIENMRTARLLVTDTYHCCVNAMAMRKPVVGIGRKADAQTGTLGDYKKKILFEMFGLSDFYVEIGDEGFDEAATARVRAAARQALDRAGSEDLFAEVARQTEAYRTRLAQALEA